MFRRYPKIRDHIAFLEQILAKWEQVDATTSMDELRTSAFARQEHLEILENGFETADLLWLATGRLDRLLGNALTRAAWIDAMNKRETWERRLRTFRYVKAELDKDQQEEHPAGGA